ncbi:DMT family transporter [Rhizobium sp. KVB221]|uniref:DMT family transporter n=1 Tax=Rhizobium setariae TaxID=2801340 RepID=A0A936YQS1_9HYPH|nr:DMT family transporter [Rhizobium setariae]MBL0371101.1 DMT family transporter [Rhizobium setariae]
MDKTTANPLRGIAMKVMSIMLFICMQGLIKEGGKGIATGEITFFRSFFAMVPILGWLAFRGDLPGALKTANPVGHFYRGFIGVISMTLGFYGIVHLPLPESIAISYAMPLFSVIAGAVLLKEDVHRYRWGAVGAGFVGVVIILWPRLDMIRQGTFGAGATAGALAVLCSAAMAAIAMVHVRQLVRTERTPTIVFYFSLSSSIFSLMTLPFGWNAISMPAALMLIGAGFIGGVAQILLTESYRYADVSAVAPFEYTSIIWGTLIGYLFFNELPDETLLVGAAIVISAGIFIIFRERQRAVDTARKDQSLTP